MLSFINLFLISVNNYLLSNYYFNSYKLKSFSHSNDFKYQIDIRYFCEKYK